MKKIIQTILIVTSILSNSFAQYPINWDCRALSYIFGSEDWKSENDRTVSFGGGEICPSNSWKLVFYDEFNGTSLDPNKWITFFPYGYNGTDQCQFCRTHDTNTSQQIYKDNNVVVNAGTAKIIAKREQSSWYGVTQNYSSGVIHLQNNLSFNKGKFEARCKIPKGLGYFPAFWLFGSSTEIDIFEFGGHATKYPQVSVHKWLPGNISYSWSQFTLEQVDLSLDFHTYAVEWDDFITTFSIDNIVVRKIPRYANVGGNWITSCGNKPPGPYVVNPAYPNSNDYVKIIFNLAFGMGDNQCSFIRAPVTGTVFPQQMEIDYIRVWQRTPQSGLTDLCNRTIQGNNFICNTPTTYTVATLPNDTYIWTASPNLSIIGSATNGSVQVAPINTTTQGNAWVKCMIASPNGVCSNLSLTKNIWLNAPVSPTFTTAQPLCQEPIVNISETANSINSTYNWTVQIDNDPTYTVAGNKNISVDGLSYGVHTFRYSVVVNNSCGAAVSPTRTTSSIKCKAGTNIMWRAVPNPNPSNTYFSIDFESITDEGDDIKPSKFELILYNLENKEVLRTLANTNERIDISTLPDGVYIANIVLPSGESQSIKIIKTNK